MHHLPPGRRDRKICAASRLIDDEHSIDGHLHRFSLPERVAVQVQAGVVRIPRVVEVQIPPGDAWRFGLPDPIGAVEHPRLAFVGRADANQLHLRRGPAERQFVPPVALHRQRGDRRHDAAQIRFDQNRARDGARVAVEGDARDVFLIRVPEIVPIRHPVDRDIGLRGDAGAEKIQHGRRGRARPANFGGQRAPLLRRRTEIVEDRPDAPRPLVERHRRIGDRLLVYEILQRERHPLSIAGQNLIAEAFLLAGQSVVPRAGADRRRNRGAVIG